MKGLARSLLIVAAIAAGAHIAAVWLLPRALMLGPIGLPLEEGAGINGIYHAPRADSRWRSVVRPSPDLFYSLCSFDLSQGPVRLRAEVPQTYWSLSLFAANSDNFYTLNDRQAGSGSLEITLTDRPDSPAGAIYSPTTRGVAVFRTLITGEEQLAQLDALRRRAACEVAGG